MGSFERIVLALSLGAVTAWSALAAEAPAPRAAAQSADADTDRRIDEMLTAIVRVRTRALPDARSNATLGKTREGSGVVIEAGYVLTIGYLVIEPEAIEVTSAGGKTLPAVLAGYDHATGFGLLRVQGQLEATPIVLGESGGLTLREPVIIVPHGGREMASLANVMSTRRFTGSWEYLLDTAIFTTPPTMNWSGAALVNRDLKLVGVGSLFVRDAVEPGEPLPGNMFVPIDLLKPILADLKAKGRAAAAPRPWLGLATEEVHGRLFVTRISPDGPADRAGVKEGDVVVAVSGAPVKTHVDLYRRIWALGAAGVEVPLQIVQEAGVRDVRVRSIDRIEYFRRKAVD